VAELGRRLAGVGLRVVDNVYADHISVGAAAPGRERRLRRGRAERQQQPRPAARRRGLLVVLWA
jgi:hypothetical protein